jgi:hypothetical protein
MANTFTELLPALYDAVRAVASEPTGVALGGNLEAPGNVAVAVELAGELGWVVGEDGLPRAPHLRARILKMASRMLDAYHDARDAEYAGE